MKMRCILLFALVFILVLISFVLGQGDGGANASVTVDTNSVTVVRGISTEIEFTITNHESKTITLNTEVQGDIAGSLEVPKYIPLLAGKSAKIKYNFRDPVAGIKFGKIIFRKGDILVNEIPLTINVVEELFTVEQTILLGDEYLKISDPEILPFDIKLVQINPLEQVSVSLSYLIKDSDEKVKLRESEKVDVFDEVILNKEFNITGFAPDKYSLEVTLNYPGANKIKEVEFDIGLVGDRSGLAIIVILASGMAFFILVFLIILIYLLKGSKVQDTLASIDPKEFSVIAR